MQWKSKNYGTVKNAIEQKSSLRAQDLIDPKGPFFIQNLDLMAGWIQVYASEMNAPITVIGDYDADGICATAGLYLMLRELGGTNIKLRLPRRMSEGYGLSEKIVDEIDRGVIITVDNGISAISAIEKAKKKGLIVLVIDHHEPKLENGKIVLPNADLIVDPHVPDELICKENLVKSTFNGYCGAGLAYKLAQYCIPNTMTLRKISAFAAIATIADVMPLISDNRNIYREGIWNIREKCITPGLQCIVDFLNSGNIVNEVDIGFKLAPILNAPGRLYDDGASMSLGTLISDNFMSARSMAAELQSINEIRKKVKEDAVNRALDMIERENLKNDNPIVICDPETAEGVVGLVAGAICEEFNVSAIVFTETEHGLKGSARAVDYNNIKDALDKFHDIHPDILTKYGGHKGAAGLSISEKGFLTFRSEMNKIVGPPQEKSEIIEYDLEIDSSEIPYITEEIQRYAPFGESNPPIFVKINNFTTIPSNNEFYTELKKGAVKFRSNECDAIAFDMAKKFREKDYPVNINVIGTLGYKNYKGNCKIQLEVNDFEPIRKEKDILPINQSIASILSQKYLAL